MTPNCLTHFYHVATHVGCHTASSGGYWRHFYSDSEATEQCELFLTAPNRNILTYLLSQPLQIMLSLFYTYATI